MTYPLYHIQLSQIIVHFYSLVPINNAGKRADDISANTDEETYYEKSCGGERRTPFTLINSHSN